MKKFSKLVGIVLLIAAVSAGTTYLVLTKTNLTKTVSLVQDKDPNGVDFAYARFANLPEAGETDFTQAAELSVNAVVHVKTTYAAKANNYSIDPFFEYFFGRPLQQEQQPQQMASGSGVILSEDGYIVTNNHVIENAQNIEVVLNDKRSFTATLVGTDPNTDIALLKIEAENLPVIIMGNSDDLRVGEWVLAVGNPFNLTSTVTAGIVSAKARNINILDAEMKIESFIQTDAAVNPGNSGGALVNTHGELIGINTAIASQTGSYAGYSFAVPVSIVRKVVSDIKQFGVVQRAILGVQIQEITSELKQSQNLATLQGAYVAEIVRDGAADMAGIKKGDIITGINGARVTSASELQEQIGRYRPGDRISITILRGTNEMEMSAELTNKNGSTSLVEKDQQVSVLGAQFREVSPATQQSLGINYGLQVTSLQKGKLQEAGVKQNFIILKANNRSIRGENDLQDVLNNALQGTDQDKVLFLAGIYPNGKVSYYAVDLN